MPAGGDNSEWENAEQDLSYGQTTIRRFCFQSVTPQEMQSKGKRRVFYCVIIDNTSATNFTLVDAELKTEQICKKSKIL